MTATLPLPENVRAFLADLADRPPAFTDVPASELAAAINALRDRASALLGDRTPLCAREFPGFVLDVTLPEGFDDVSWHNDCAPCFASAAAGVCVFIDYADEAQRSGVCRFIVCTYGHDGAHLDDPVDLYAGDNWPEAVAAIAAHAGTIPHVTVGATLPTTIEPGA